MTASRIPLKPSVSSVAVGLALAILAAAPCSAAPDAASVSAPATVAPVPIPAAEPQQDSAPITLAPLPPTAPGRSVIADVPTMVLAVQAGERRLRDFDAEESSVIAQINRSPSTWQTYLLYTAEDLPEQLFMPGFTFVLGAPKKRDTTPVLVETVTTAPPPGN